VNPQSFLAGPATGSAPSGGYSPSQVRHGYGFDQVMFGSVQGDGTGQTIAIIDAYDQPNIVSDLATFDATLGIQAPPSFRKVNQTGGSAYPTVDNGWGLEISLDVEWAHGIAPGANILLVEANSNNFADLYTAIDYARNQPGVSVISMSFGGTEWSGETGYESHFTTPAGHNGVSFIASTGDAGSTGAPEYPSISPNVLGVGGTALSLDGAGNYLSETAWSGSGGGVSVYYSQPSYQKGVVTQSSTKRTTPDVSYDASSDTPFGVYDTSGYSGWINVYGTSAGAPQWAALIAIANQGRVAAGQSTLDGPSQTLPKLYQLPQSDFHDITNGNNGGYSAGAGYDLVTGRGSPYANLIIPALIDSGSTNQPPTVATPASATPNPVAGTTTNLSVLGADSGGAAGLTYTWTVINAPAGAPAPTFSANGSNAAQNSTATFHAAGNYTFLVTITDPGGLTATSSVTVTVAQTFISLAVSPGSVSLAGGATQQFSATGKDQFGNALTNQPTVAWTLSGIGSLSSSGLYTAPASNGTATVQASAGGFSNTASITVSASAPTVVTPAAATPNPVTGTSTTLSALGTDVSGASSLKYTWTVTSAPAGAPAPGFSANGSNAAQNTTATFHAAGSYTFQVNITDPAGLTATSSVTVIVNQTATSLALSPTGSTLAAGATQQFTVVARDQFGNSLSSQPAFSWALTGIGTLSGSGLYTAPGGTGTASVQAGGAGLTSTASVTVVPAAPTNVTATTVSKSQISLTWTESTTNITGFSIQRSTNGTSWSQLATVGASATSYRDTSVGKNRSYYYRVSATSTVGNSSWTTSGATPARAAESTPVTPTLTGPADGTGTRPTFTWTASDAATQYDVWADNLTTGQKQVVRATVTGTSFTATNPLPGGQYIVWVRASNSDGVFSAWSAGYTFLIDTSAPAIPTITGPGTPTTSLTPTIAWSASGGAAYYDLWVDDLSTHRTQVIRQQALTTNSFTPTSSLTVGSYVAWVRAFDNTNQTRGWSATFHFTISPPNPPSATSVLDPADSRPTFSWGAVTGAVKYDLWVDDLSSGQTQVIREQNLLSNSFTPLTALTKGTYRFWVRAVGSNGDVSSWSGSVDVVIG
jgi:hypothetical protein